MKIYKIELDFVITLYSSSDEFENWKISDKIRKNEIAIFIEEQKFANGKICSIWLSSRGIVGMSRWLPPENYPTTFVAI